MPSSVIYICSLCFVTSTLTTAFFNRKVWFEEGNIFHIHHEQFWTAFQQHRNVNRHIDWLSTEISSLNGQIKLVKDRLLLSTRTREQRVIIPKQYTDTPNTSLQKDPSVRMKVPRNLRNIEVLKQLTRESLFNGYLQDLVDIYSLSFMSNIECIAIVIDKDSVEKYLFIQLSNKTMDSYQMNRSKPLKDNLWKLDQPMSAWNNARKQLEYYRRFIDGSKMNEIMVTDQLNDIKHRQKVTEIGFFDMMGQILRVKYHIDPSSLSCILEAFFDSIYTCDGRLIHPHELQLLSNDQQLFVFYAVMMDTTTEKQIYPLEIDNRIRVGDQIFFLFNTHPQYNSLSSLTCPDCPWIQQANVIDNTDEQVEQVPNNPIVEPAPTIESELSSPLVISQNLVVYAIMTSLVIYLLFSMYLARQTKSTASSGRRHSIYSRRGQ